MSIAHLIALLVQAAVAAPPPPLVPNADFTCRLFDNEQKQSILKGRVRVNTKPQSSGVVVDIEPEISSLPKVSQYAGPIYGNLFDARYFSDPREIHYKFQLPQTNGKNGTVQVLNINKSSDGTGSTVWAATGLCDFVMRTD